MTSASDAGVRWAPSGRASLSEDIADRLVRGILNGRFSFGEKLPPERELAKYFNVGRPTVREAITTLRVIGLVEVRPGEGTFIVDEHAGFIAKAFSWTVLLDARSAAEVIEARVAIESDLARLAAQRAVPATVETLRELVAAMEAANGQPAPFSAADLQFHLTIAEAADNITLYRLLLAIQSLLRQWITRALQEPATYGKALDHHRRILAAIDAHDADAAALSMRAHLLEMGSVLLASVSRHDRTKARTIDEL